MQIKNNYDKEVFSWDIGTKKALAIAVNNAQTQQRYTFLDERLKLTD